MIRETMTSDERMDAATRLEPVDRIPILVGTSSPFVARCKGMSVAEAYADFDTIIRCETELYDALGGWDGRYSAVGAHSHGVLATTGPTYWGIRRLMPGEDLPETIDVQNVEQEIMREDEYDRLLEIGWDDFYLELVNRLGEKVTRDMVAESRRLVIDRMMKAESAFRKKGVQPFLSAGVMDPATMLALWRSYVPFTRDIHRQYDKVKAAIDLITASFLDAFREQIRHAGARRVMVPAARYVVPAVPPKVFEDIQWSWMKAAVDIAIEEGVTPVFHLDSDWTETLPYLKQMPKGRCIVHFGGETDIFKAKEILGGHMCIMGDISPAMMSVSSVREIEEYCARLIHEIGGGNGFIMCEGCYLPATAKFENVKAMVDTTKNAALR